MAAPPLTDKRLAAVLVPMPTLPRVERLPLLSTRASSLPALFWMEKPLVLVLSNWAWMSAARDEAEKEKKDNMRIKKKIKNCL